MLRVQSELLTALQSTLDKLLTDAGLEANIQAQFESPKVAAHGDLAITSAMQLSKTLKANPRALGETMKAALEATPAFAKWAEPLEIAGPGFINIRLKPAAKQTTVTDILQSQSSYGLQTSTGERLLVEFVSANPTGPLHVGHGRQAALGDAICNLFATQGVSVYREFYYNDAGVQIETLTKSTQRTQLARRFTTASTSLTLHETTSPPAKAWTTQRPFVPLPWRICAMSKI